MPDEQEPRTAGKHGSAARLVIVDPDLPARQRRTLGSGLPRYPGYYESDTDIAVDAEVDLIVACGAVVVALPLGGLSYWASQHVAGLDKLELLLLPTLPFAFVTLLAGAGAAFLLLWGLFRGVPLIPPALARLAYKRLAAKHRDRIVVVASLDERCRGLAKRAHHHARVLLAKSAERSPADRAEAEARLPRALWEIAQDLEKISGLATPADKTAPDPDEDLVEQALAAVTARVEAIEAEAGQLLEHLQQDKEILAAGRRAAEEAEADKLSALRREALLDVVARSEARRDSAGLLPE